MIEKMEKAGTATFFQRFQLTERLEEMVIPFLNDANIVTSEYGQNVILGHNGSLEARLKKLHSKKSAVALMVKFAPDFVCFSRDNKVLFFMDIKTSLTPVLFGSHLQKLSALLGKRLEREQVGLVEREAWDNYSKRYPSDRTCVVIACPYTPRLLLAEWVSNVGVIFRFDADTNENAAGSQTPHTNIDLYSMRALDEFLEQEFSACLNRAHYEAMIRYVKTWPISNPGRPWGQFNTCVRQLQLSCPWLRQRDKSGYLEPSGAGKTFDF